MLVLLAGAWAQRLKPMVFFLLPLAAATRVCLEAERSPGRCFLLVLLIFSRVLLFLSLTAGVKGVPKCQRYFGGCEGKW